MLQGMAIHGEDVVVGRNGQRSWSWGNIVQWVAGVER